MFALMELYEASLDDIIRDHDNICSINKADLERIFVFVKDDLDARIINILDYNGKQMRKIAFVADENTVLKSEEVWTLKSNKQFVSIWPGDIIRAALKNGNVYVGRDLYKFSKVIFLSEY